ncbi:prolyl oligopeptidase [Xylariaceae sp. AK1471]|nr:prolyl oligopeptidase [Xylariaceae sp. AK1471]
MIVEKFSPEVLISAPRRGPAIPNHNGTFALYTESTHSIGGETRKEVYLLDVTTGVSRCILHDAKAYDPTWFGDDSNRIVYLRNGDMGITFVLTLDVNCPTPETSVAGLIRAPVQGLKVKSLGDGTVAFTVLGYVGTDGELLNTEIRLSHGGKVYDSSRLRPGDLRKGPHTYTIWYSTFSKQDGVWRIAGDLHNALEATNLHIPQDADRYGDTRDQYGLCDKGIVVAAENSKYSDPVWGDVNSVYFIRVHSFDTGTLEAPKKITPQSDEYQGLCSFPQFSPSGSMIAFLRRPRSNSEGSQIYVHHMESRTAISVFDMVTGKPWPLAPTSFRFSADGHSVYITAHDCGQVGLYHLNLQPNAYPRPLLRNGSVSSCYPLGKSNGSRVLVTSSSFVESCLYQVVSHDPVVEPVILSSASKHGFKFGLSPRQVSEIYFEGGGNYIVHAWIVKPRHFDGMKKYPLAVLVHDGPSIGAWLNAWNVKWNAAAWAEQGYVVVLPNITGSTGYGQAFATALCDDWSGRPYDDLVNCIYGLRGVPGVDVDNAIIAGAGYGGYLINWIQGHPLARRFKAMVCHAGIFSTSSMAFQTNLLEFNEQHIAGVPISGTSSETLERCNPARPTLLQNWKTPMLVIHNEKDTFSPVSEGLALYNNLQSSSVPSMFLTFADEGHDVVKEENSLEWHRQVFAWVNRFTDISEEEEHVVDDSSTT